MPHKLKILGPALLVVLALGAATAPSAGAEFISGSEATQLTAQALSNQTFATGELEVTCTGVSLDSTTIGLVQSEITARPTYSGCKAVSLGVEAKVDMNECDYLLTTEEKEAVHIKCPEGKKIELTIFLLGTFRKCLDIEAQTPTSPTLHYTNATNGATGKMDIEAEFATSGVKYELTGLCGSAVKDNLTAGGKVTLTGDNAIGNPTNVTHATETQIFDFKWEPGKSLVTGSSEGPFSWGFGLGTVKCTEAEEGTESEATESSELELALSAGECTLSEAPVAIDFNGCLFQWKEVGLDGKNYEGSAGISCAGGKKIEITVNGCTVTVFTQTDLKKVTYTNKGKDENREITVDLNLTGITYEEDEKDMSKVCKNPGVKKTDGTLTGSRTLTAENGDAEMGGLWVE